MTELIVGNETPELTPRAQFGEQLWAKVSALALGSLTKRELEITILAAAIDSGLIDGTPHAVASSFKLTLARATTYLTELALRSPPFDDRTAVAALLRTAANSEVVADARHLSIPLEDARLRLWIERQVSSHGLNSGDVFRRDHIRITPVALGVLLSTSGALASPHVALGLLPTVVKQAPWYADVASQWKPGIGWRDALSQLSNVSSLVQLLPLLASLKLT